MYVSYPVAAFMLLGGNIKAKHGIQIQHREDKCSGKLPGSATDLVWDRNKLSCVTSLLFGGWLVLHHNLTQWLIDWYKFHMFLHMICNWGNRPGVTTYIYINGFGSLCSSLKGCHYYLRNKHCIPYLNLHQSLTYFGPNLLLQTCAPLFFLIASVFIILNTLGTDTELEKGK